eukprot:gene175-184_t
MWQLPEKIVLTGKNCRLEPLDIKHSDEIYEIAALPEAKERYRYLLGSPPSDRVAFDQWMTALLNNEQRIPFVVIDIKTGKVGGFQQFMNIVPQHGSVEIGAILWGPSIARSRISTEAFYLFADYALSVLKYRRLEWKCNNANEASKRAAIRFGFTFEGVFRQHMFLEGGENRDTAWFSIIDKEWLPIKQALEEWLEPNNFDEKGMQLQDLASLRSSIASLDGLNNE